MIFKFGAELGCPLFTVCVDKMTIPIKLEKGQLYSLIDTYADSTNIYYTVLGYEDFKFHEIYQKDKLLYLFSELIPNTSTGTSPDSNPVSRHIFLLHGESLVYLLDAQLNDWIRV